MAKRDIKIYENRVTKLRSKLIKMRQDHALLRRRLEIKQKRFEDALEEKLKDAQETVDFARADWNERHPNDPV